MHQLLTKLFEKRGIKDARELSEEERKDFDNWNAVLSKEELTLEDVKEFCQTQVEVIENKWKDLSVSNAQKAEWIPIHNVYSTILLAIKSPRSAREALENQLNQLLK